MDTVNIGKQTWLKHNLNLMPSNGNSWCWGEGKNCDKYGRLYDWQAAMSGICPEGFHLPTNDDWNELLLYLDEEYDKDAILWCDDKACFYSGESTCACNKTSAKILKAQEGWIDCAAPARICKIIAENDALTYGGKRPCPGDVIYIAVNSSDALEFTVAKPYELPEEHLGYELTSCDYVTNKNLMLEFIEPPCDYKEVKVKCK